MTLGFTGTSRGMTLKQTNTVRALMNTLGVTVLHHGDCVGADAQAHAIATVAVEPAEVVIHPPSDNKLRAFCSSPMICPPKPYLKRNRDIVAEGVDGLIAAPKDFVQPASLRGQGTWTTIGYARQAGRKIWIVFPDGTIKTEGVA